MGSLSEIRKNIFRVKSPEDFNVLAMHIFHYQAGNNPIYRQFIQQLDIKTDTVKTLEEVPFLPISFFKTHRILTGYRPPDIVFFSSGTTGMKPSRHEVADLSLYESSFLKCFRMFYGRVTDYCFLALLPSYLSQQGSSLVYMAGRLITKSCHPFSGFYLDSTDSLLGVLEQLKISHQPAILLGVSFALLDIANHHTLDYPGLIVMETGGMKGRRREMIREELHERLCRGFGVAAIHSEYGMTELLSQAYSRGNGIFRTPPWMRILIRDANDPLSLTGHHQAGGINIIDLANIHSCSFIATQDLGRSYPDGSFEVLGRFDDSDVRGCNLLV
ncbi:MAG: acyltransferase [Bacteroidales bacterium]|nr:acyltransferase [Bacteroidales bacterium]